MNCKLFVAVFIIIAVVLGILGLVPKQMPQEVVAYAGHFFMVMAPVLAVAALLKYVACCNGNKNDCSKK